MNSNLPSISIIIQTLNSDKIIDKCLRSISIQDYPKERIEILIIDGGSSDSTIKKGKHFGATIIVEKDKRENQESRKAVGLLKARNDIVAFIDSDNILPHPKWLLKMVKPFCEDEQIVATQPLRYAYDKSASLLNRYFALFGVNDPVPYYLNKRDRLSWVEQSWNLLGSAEDRGDYYFVKFKPDAVPTLGANGFLARRNILLKAKCSPEEFFHIDVNCDLISLGYNTYGIVKEDIIHISGDKIYSFIRKRFRYMKQYYLKDKSLRRYKLCGASDRKNLLKYIFFSLTIIEPLIQSVRGYLKIRDKAWFLHPVMCLAALYIYGFAVVQWWPRSLTGVK